jgi:hypothetical protein
MALNFERLVALGTRDRTADYQEICPNCAWGCFRTFHSPSPLSLATPGAGSPAAQFESLVLPHKENIMARGAGLSA